MPTGLHGEEELHKPALGAKINKDKVDLLGNSQGSFIMRLTRFVCFGLTVLDSLLFRVTPSANQMTRPLLVLSKISHHALVMGPPGAWVIPGGRWEGG